MNQESGYKNEHTPITRNDIPADILEIILWMIATGPSHELEDRGKGVVAISQACRAWRSAALQARAIWASVIDFENHSFLWIEELIRRSAPAPLDFGVIGSPVYTYRKDVASIFDGQSEARARIRAISLRVGEQDWKTFDLQFCQELPPHIEYLNLQNLAPSFPIFVYPIFIERRQISSLRCLHLRSVRFRITDEASFPNLEELSIDYGYDSQVYIPQLALSDMLQLLEKAPNLRYLALMDCIVAPTEPYDHLASVQLNRLELLLIDGTAGACHSLMNKLCMPTDCGLMICFCPESPFYEIWVRDFIESRLRLWQDDSPDRSFHARHVLRDDLISFENIIVDSTCHYRDLALDIFKGKYTSPDPPLMIRLRTMFTSLFVSLFSTFRFTFPTTTFLRLWIEWDPQDGSGERVFGDLVPDFCQMVNLQTLEILNSSHQFLFPMFQQTPPDPGSVQLPSLKVVRFLPFSSLAPDKAELKDICAFLRWRTNRGFSVPNLDPPEFFSYP